MFVLITRERKEIIHSLKNLSSESHTAAFLAEKINEVITNVGPEKFSAVVSDHVAACAGHIRRLLDAVQAVYVGGVFQCQLFSLRFSTSASAST